MRWFSPAQAGKPCAWGRYDDEATFAATLGCTRSPGSTCRGFHPPSRLHAVPLVWTVPVDAPRRGLLAEREAGEPLERLRVDLEPRRDRLVDHPAERDVGEAVVVVLTSDVAVDPGEPLLDVPAPGRGHGLRVEAVDRVGASLLVQGHRVPRGLDVEDAPRRRPACLLELRLEVQPADGLDGVPDPEEPHLVHVRVERVREVRVAEALVEQPTRPEELGLLLGRRVLRPVLGVELEGVRREVVDPGPQQADGAQHPRQGPRRVGAAGEAEDEDPVAALVVRRQPGVGLLDVVLHPEPDHEARDPRRLLARARHRPARAHRADAGVVVDELALGLHRDGVRPRDVRRPALRLVARAVQADHQVPRHSRLPPPPRSCGRGDASRYPRTSRAAAFRWLRRARSPPNSERRSTPPVSWVTMVTINSPCGHRGF